MKRFIILTLMALIGAVLFTGCSQNAKNLTSVPLPDEPQLVITPSGEPAIPRYTVNSVQSTQGVKSININLSYDCSMVLNGSMLKDHVIGILYSGKEVAALTTFPLTSQPTGKVEWTVTTMGGESVVLDSVALDFCYEGARGPITESYSIKLGGNK